VSNTGNKYFQK